MECRLSGSLASWGCRSAKGLPAPTSSNSLKKRLSARPIKTFLFGGAAGIAALVEHSLNLRPQGLSCVGSFYPGFGTVDLMSTDEILNTINSSRAEFLAVALNASKGQTWLHRNHNRLQIPIRAQLGAAINFQAGTLKRAPNSFRKLGFEWLWRIKEEPYLWRRFRRRRNIAPESSCSPGSCQLS